jgi:hypothetical protein
MTMKAIFYSINLFFLFQNFCFAQDTNIFKQINTQVWEKFENAFATNNPELLNSLHTTDILRIPADSKTIIGGQEYFNSQIESFGWIKENGYKTEMELRFIERINYSNYASERGIFNFTVIEPGNIIRQYFGKFHMILIKEDDFWKIHVDYDSTENGTINETTFLSAFDKWNFKPFLIQSEE